MNSYGILLYRRNHKKTEVLLLHPGGPFFAKKDLGAWSIPKGLQEPGETALQTATREFAEETGQVVTGNFLELPPVKLKSGKTVMAFACEGDLDVSKFHSNTFRLEWPPRSGRYQEFPEADRAAWFDMAEAAGKINAGQKALLDALQLMLSAGHA